MLSRRGNTFVRGVLNAVHFPLKEDKALVNRERFARIGGEFDGEKQQFSDLVMCQMSRDMKR
jgi:hypothetical protein